jgi:hypothetical protein
LSPAPPTGSDGWPRRRCSKTATRRCPRFNALFPNQARVETLITNDMNVSRRPLAQMNPLSVDDVTNVEVAFRKWVKQLKQSRT